MASSDKIHVVIDNKLYDLTKFAKTHPGGRLILENFHDCEVTDYFYALHSKQAQKMLKNMPYTDIAEEDKVPQTDYLKLLFKLEKTELFKADYVVEFVQIFHTLALFFLATYYGSTYPVFSAICLGFGTLIGGWVGHQCDHQRDNIMRDVNLVYATVCDGLSPHWWSTKHNRHHLSTNETDHDGDIQLFPFIYLWTPKKSEDRWNRTIQHIYFTALYTILQIKWQIDSIFWAYANRNYKELVGLAIHWTWYIAFLPWQVWTLGVLIAGTISAFVVTASHQAEHKYEGKKEFITEEGNAPRSKYQIHDYFTHQVVTTRNIDLKNWFLNYICGGMQYQIEHHVFPRIPLYKLPLVKTVVQDYCKEHGLEYRDEGFYDIMKRNYDHIANIATVKARE